MEELKRCPFCGSLSVELSTAAEIDMDDEDCAGEQWAVVCNYNNGGCGATSGYRNTPEAAVEAWNRRQTWEN